MSVSRSSNGLSLSKFSPVAAEAVRAFASIVEKGAATAKAFGDSFRQGRGRTGRRSPISSLGKRVVALRRAVICDEDRDERGGSRGWQGRAARTRRPAPAARDVGGLRGRLKPKAFPQRRIPPPYAVRPDALSSERPSIVRTLPYLHEFLAPLPPQRIALEAAQRI